MGFDTRVHNHNRNVRSLPGVGEAVVGEDVGPGVGPVVTMRREGRWLGVFAVTRVHTTRRVRCSPDVGETVVGEGVGPGVGPVAKRGERAGVRVSYGGCWGMNTPKAANACC